MATLAYRNQPSVCLVFLGLAVAVTALDAMTSGSVALDAFAPHVARGARHTKGLVL